MDDLLNRDAACGDLGRCCHGRRARGRRGLRRAHRHGGCRHNALDELFDDDAARRAAKVSPLRRERRQVAHLGQIEQIAVLGNALVKAHKPGDLARFGVGLVDEHLDEVARENELARLARPAHAGQRARHLVRAGARSNPGRDALGIGQPRRVGRSEREGDGAVEARIARDPHQLILERVALLIGTLAHVAHRAVGQTRQLLEAELKLGHGAHVLRVHARLSRKLNVHVDAVDGATVAQCRVRGHEHRADRVECHHRSVDVGSLSIRAEPRGMLAVEADSPPARQAGTAEYDGLLVVHDAVHRLARVEARLGGEAARSVAVRLAARVSARRVVAVRHAASVVACVAVAARHAADVIRKCEGDLSDLVARIERTVARCGRERRGDRDELVERAER